MRWNSDLYFYNVWWPQFFQLTIFVFAFEFTVEAEHLVIWFKCPPSSHPWDLVWLSAIYILNQIFKCLLYSATICTKGFEMDESNTSFKIDSSPNP